MTLPSGKWRDRFIAALRTSLTVLAPHRTALQALIPVLISTGEDGLFAAGTAFSRVRVQGVFEEAVVGATDAPAESSARPLGRLLYVAHVLVLLWWLLDRTVNARATDGLLRLIEQMLAPMSLAVRVPSTRRLVIGIDRLMVEALFEQGR